MTPRAGRPKHVDRGTERRPFGWLGVADVVSTTRFCTVTWMRHGHQLSAMATHRDERGLDLTFVGMAQGEIGGLMRMIGDAGEYPICRLIGHQPEREHDSMDAVMTAAVISLERAVRKAASVDPEEEGEDHKWDRDGRDQAARRTGRKVLR